MEGFTIAAAVPLAVTDDPAAAMSAFRGELVRYTSQPFYRAMLTASGHASELAEFDQEGRVPESLALPWGASATSKVARAFVEAYRVAGVTLPLVRPITFPDAPWYRPTLEAAATW